MRQGVLSTARPRYRRHFDDGGLVQGGADGFSPNQMGQVGGPLYQASVATPQQFGGDAQTPDNSGALAQNQAYQAARSKLDAANADRLQKIQDAQNILRAGQTGQSVNLPMMAFGAGMLKPTNTGSFSESLGNAFGAAMPAIAQQRQADQQYNSSMANLTMKEGDVAQQAAHDALQEVGLNFFKQGQLDTTRLQQAETARRDQAQEEEATRHNREGEANARASTAATRSYYDYLKTPDEDEPDRWVPVKDQETGKTMVDPNSGLGLYVPWAGRKELGPPVPYDPTGDAAGGKTGQTQVLAQQLIADGSAKTMQEALAIIHDPSGKSVTTINASKERLAQGMAKGDPNSTKDPYGTLEKARQFYGLPPGNGPAQATPSPAQPSWLDRFLGDIGGSKKNNPVVSNGGGVQEGDMQTGIDKRTGQPITLKLINGAWVPQ